jgi:hypothetical protein
MFPFTISLFYWCLPEYYCVRLSRHHGKEQTPLPEGIKTLPDIFYEAGYFVDYHGKTHFNFKYEGHAIKDRNWQERKEQQPFFLVLQTKHTHRPFTRDTIRPIDPAKIDIPPILSRS